MLILEVIRVALQSIKANLFRALLTMLGIIIGVAAVITMVALGTGAQQAIDEQIASLGSNILQVSSRQGMHRGISRDQLKLSVDDAQALARDAVYIQAVVPEIPTRLQVKKDNINLNVQVVGTTANYADVHAFDLAHGQMFTAADDAARRRVVVLGGELPEMLETPAEQLLGGFMTMVPIRQEVRFGVHTIRIGRAVLHGRSLGQPTAEHLCCRLSKS